MLFNGSCSRCLRAIWSFVWSIETADMTKQGKRGPGQCLKVCFNIGEQLLKVAPLMMMGDDAARDARTSIQSDWHPDHRRACRPGRVAPSTQSARLAYEQGTCRRVDLEMISYHDGDSPATGREGSGGTHLFAEHIGGACFLQSCHPPSHPANLPNQSRRRMPVVPRSLDQPLPTTPFEAPDPADGWDERHIGSHPVDRGRLVAPGPAKREDQWEADPTDRPRQAL